MKHISIKTVDGNRYDFMKADNEESYSFEDGVISVTEGNEIRLFILNNIASITIKVEDG